MYKRKIEETFCKWKKKEGHKPLVIKGCRQCGKTSSVVNFANYHVYHALKVGDYNIGRSGPLLTLPFYMTFLLTDV